MSACRYCGADFYGDQTKKACSICGQKIPTKSLMEANRQMVHADTDPNSMGRAVAARAETAAQFLQPTVRHGDVRTPNEIKQAFGQRLAAKQRPKSFSPGRFFATLFFMPVWMASLAPLIQSHKTHLAEVPSLGLMGGIVPAVAAFFISRVAGRGFVRSMIATVVYGITALLVVTKPFIAPMSWEYDGATHPFSPTSETHLYFLIPGAILCFFTVVRFFTIMADFAAMFRRDE